jgi:DNA-binding XRE family transcriptional regulator
MTWVKKMLEGGPVKVSNGSSGHRELGRKDGPQSMLNPYTERIGHNVRRLAKERGWPLERVALEAGVSRSHFFYVLSGRRNPSLGTLKKLADALHVDVSKLWKP